MLDASLSSQVCRFCRQHEFADSSAMEFQCHASSSTPPRRRLPVSCIFFPDLLLFLLVSTTSSSSSGLGAFPSLPAVYCGCGCGGGKEWHCCPVAAAAEREVALGISSAARPPKKHGPASRRPRPSAESAPLSQPLYCLSSSKRIASTSHSVLSPCRWSSKI
jgi:hypothetical protein